jgi:pyruvate/2-oxoglutarate dehydrogenase complex dihydrolipoamide acyltransferase (E2) component
VRKLASQYGVDLNQIQGTGAGGRITKQDVLNFVAKAEKAAKPTPPKIKPEVISLDKEEVRPLSLMRKTIAARMVTSHQTAAHVTAVIEVNMDNVEQVRTAFKERFKKQEGFSLTYLPFVCQAVISGLKQFPVLNSSLNEDKLIIKHYVNLGIAVALEDGLIVPVIKGADELSLLGLARKIKDVADRARAHKLLPDEVHEGTFTITNPGVFGTVIQTPIINPPQVGILSLEAVKKRVVVIDDAIAIKPMVNLCLSYDHRVLDGGTAAQFLTYVKNELEQRNFTAEFS